MAKTLTAGGNIAVTENGSPSTLSVTTGWDFIGSEFYIDACALACDTGSNVVDEAHFVYFNNETTPDAGIRLEQVNAPSTLERERMSIDLNKLSIAIDRIVFAAIVYEAEAPGKSFKDTRNVTVRVLTSGGDEVVSFEVDAVSDPVTALLLGELYRNKGEWKFRAVGQGYRRGLTALADAHGLTLST